RRRQDEEKQGDGADHPLPLASSERAAASSPNAAPPTGRKIPDAAVGTGITSNKGERPFNWAPSSGPAMIQTRYEIDPPARPIESAERMPGTFTTQSSAPQRRRSETDSAWTKEFVR